MPDSRYRKCVSGDCDTLASFGPPASGARLFCAAHRKSGMVNVINPVCLHPECLVQAAFGTPARKRMYCSQHKGERMLHVRKLSAVDVNAPVPAS